MASVAKTCEISPHGSVNVDADQFTTHAAGRMQKERPMDQPEILDCPTCGAKLVPIIYGLPGSPELWDAKERGDIEFGGCCIDFNAPNRVCRGKDQHGWREDEDGVLTAIA